MSTDITHALREVSALGGFFTLPTTVHRTPDSALTSPNSPSYFTGLARSVTARYATDETRVGVSIAHLGLAARVWSPTLACALLYGIVPDLDGLEWTGEGAALRLAAPAALPAEALFDQVDGVLRHVERTLPVKLAPRLLAGNMASALAGTASVLSRTRPDLHPTILTRTRHLLTQGRLHNTGHLTPGPPLTFHRRSCCLYYRVPGGSVCGDCCFAG